MRRSLRRRLVRMIAAVHLLVAAGPLSASVVCAGTDGHVAIESALLDECCPAAEQTTPELAPVGDHGGCTDTPVLVDAALQKKTSADDGSLASAVVTPASPATTGFTRITSFSKESSLSRAPVLRRTVVLLL